MPLVDLHPRVLFQDRLKELLRRRLFPEGQREDGFLAMPKGAVLLSDANQGGADFVKIFRAQSVATRIHLNRNQPQIAIRLAEKREQPSSRRAIRQLQVAERGLSQDL